jgi:Ser-tRNA(Ala) deacylase AlaX
MPNIFLQHSEMLSHSTSIRAIRPVGCDGFAIALQQNIIRPEGGGQPRDHARITVGGDAALVTEVFKADGETWIVSEDLPVSSLNVNDMVLVEVDAPRRRALSLSHSLSHLLMAAARHVTKGFNSMGASIGNDGRTVQVRFRSETSLDDNLLDVIDALTRYFVKSDAKIESVMLKSVADAERRFCHWRIDSALALSGKIRVVNISGIDTNPCSGSHARSTGEIGPFSVQGYRCDGESAYSIDVERVPSWLYWFDDEFLVRSGSVNLGAFSP